MRDEDIAFELAFFIFKIPGGWEEWCCIFGLALAGRAFAA